MVLNLTSGLATPWNLLNSTPFKTREMCLIIYYTKIEISGVEFEKWPCHTMELAEFNTIQSQGGLANLFNLYKAKIDNNGVEFSMCP